MTQELRSPGGGVADEARTQESGIVSDYESPLSSEKVKPIPKYPVMALSHMAFDPLFIEGNVRFCGWSGTGKEGIKILVEYDGIPCRVTIHTVDDADQPPKGGSDGQK